MKPWLTPCGTSFHKSLIPTEEVAGLNSHTESIIIAGCDATASFSSALLVCLLAALSGCYSGSRPARIGSSAPDFTAQDSQNKVTLSQFRGQVVVLNFWATWCPPCVEELPSLVDMQRRMKDKGVTVVAVSVDVDGNAYQQFVKSHNVNLLTVRDPDQKSNALYGTSKFPETYMIDRNGVIRRKFIGAVDWTAADYGFPEHALRERLSASGFRSAGFPKCFQRGVRDLRAPLSG